MLEAAGVGALVFIALILLGFITGVVKINLIKE